MVAVSFVKFVWLNLKTSQHGSRWALRGELGTLYVERRRLLPVSKMKRCWLNMKNRCFKPENEKYPLYGGRGITVCERWLVFENFAKDMGRIPSGKTLGRIDSNGNYEPANCRWETYVEQARSRRPPAYTNKAGLQGVNWMPKPQRWRATGGSGKVLYYGKDFFEACCVRKSWENTRRKA